MNRGEIWWASLKEPRGSEPGFRRPVIIIQADSFNKSKINTVICAVITSNTDISKAPGNVFLSSKESNLPKDSVINVSQIITLDKQYLTEFVKNMRSSIMKDVNIGIKLVLDLE